MSGKTFSVVFLERKQLPRKIRGKSRYIHRHSLNFSLEAGPSTRQWLQVIDCMYLDPVASLGFVSSGQHVSPQDEQHPRSQVSFTVSKEFSFLQSSFTWRIFVTYSSYVFTELAQLTAPHSHLHHPICQHTEHNRTKIPTSPMRPIEKTCQEPLWKQDGSFSQWSNRTRSCSTQSYRSQHPWLQQHQNGNYWIQWALGHDWSSLHGQGSIWSLTLGRHQVAAKGLWLCTHVWVSRSA